MRKLLIASMVAGTLFAAAPASATHASGYGAIQSQIGQLSNQIWRAEQRGRISHREANGLRRQAAIVHRNFRLFSRNGLSRREFAVLRSQVQQIRYNLGAERRDVDRRRG